MANLCKNKRKYNTMKMQEDCCCCENTKLKKTKIESSNLHKTFQDLGNTRVLEVCDLLLKNISPNYEELYSKFSVDDHHGRKNYMKARTNISDKKRIYIWFDEEELRGGFNFKWKFPDILIFTKESVLKFKKPTYVLRRKFTEVTLRPELVSIYAKYERKRTELDLYRSVEPIPFTNFQSSATIFYEKVPLKLNETEPLIIHCLVKSQEWNQSLTEYVYLSFLREYETRLRENLPGVILYSGSTHNISKDLNSITHSFSLTIKRQNDVLVLNKLMKSF